MPLPSALTQLRRLAGGAPAEYIAFVGRHLAPLRQAAARVVGDELDADRLYPDVLTDVAVWWVWLEFSAAFRGGGDRAERRLWRAFAHRADRWNAALEPDRGAGPDHPGAAPDRPDLDIRVWGPEGPPPRLLTGPQWYRSGRAVPRSSAALRLAPRLRPPPRPDSSAVAEAMVAWCHATEWWRRMRRIAVAALCCVILFALLRIRQAGG